MPTWGWFLYAAMLLAFIPLIRYKRRKWREYAIERKAAETNRWKRQMEAARSLSEVIKLQKQIDAKRKKQSGCECDCTCHRKRTKRVRTQSSGESQYQRDSKNAAQDSPFNNPNHPHNMF